MLPPFIIEQIRRREEEEERRRDAHQPVLELPLDDYEYGDPSPRRRAPEEDDDANRGCIIVDLG